MSQIAVANEPLQAYEGKLHERAQQIDSGLASALAYFGKGMSQSDTVDIDKLPATVQMYTSGQKFVGVAIADPTVEKISDDFGGYAANTSVQLLKKGKIWVKTGDAVDDISKSVFIRNATPGGSPPAESLGSFRATTTTGYIDLGAIANVKWIAGTTIGGANYGLLSVNEG